MNIQDDWADLVNWYDKLIQENKTIKSSVNEYRILKHIGTSGYGEIFLALTVENFLVGLKIITNKKFVESEVEHMRQCNRKINDIVLPLLDYFILSIQEDKYYILVMKYFEGFINLSEYLSKNIFHEEIKSKIKTSLIKFLEEIHQKIKIAHNDLDTNNILIHSKTLQIKIFDLGYCKTEFALSKQEFEHLKLKDKNLIERI